MIPALRRRRARRAGLLAATLLLPLSYEVSAAGPEVTVAARQPTAAAPKESPALFGVGAQPCKAFVEVSGETNGREIALSGAMFSWAQGWFSARNLIGHESKPRVVGSTLSVEALKAELVEECKTHPDEAIFLAVNDLYERLSKARF
jgi:hypothetical protein